MEMRIKLHKNANKKNNNMDIFVFSHIIECVKSGLFWRRKKKHRECSICSKWKHKWIKSTHDNMSDYYINALTRQTIRRHFSLVSSHSGERMYKKMLLKLIYVFFGRVSFCSSPMPFIAFVNGVAVVVVVLLFFSVWDCQTSWTCAFSESIAKYSISYDHTVLTSLSLRRHRWLISQNVFRVAIRKSDGICVRE